MEHVICRAEDSIASHFEDKGDIAYYMLLKALTTRGIERLQHRVRYSEKIHDDKRWKSDNQYKRPLTNDEILIQMIERKQNENCND
jgi:hypothetical protein